MTMVFKKGEVTNPKGRPKGAKGKMSKGMLNELIRIADKVEDNKIVSQGKSLLEHFVCRAYRNDQVLITYLKKIIADRNYLTETREGNGSAREPIVFEIVSTEWTRKEEMINNNREGLLNILKQLESGKINAINALKKIGEELLKKQGTVDTN